MKKFGEKLKQYRISKRATLREVGDAIGKSIGYISDIEHGRRRPPDLETVSKLEDFLGIKEGALLNLARSIRKNSLPSLNLRLRQRPKLQHALLRAEKIYEDDEKFNKLLKAIEDLEDE